MLLYVTRDKMRPIRNSLVHRSRMVHHETIDWDTIWELLYVEKQIHRLQAEISMIETSWNNWIGYKIEKYTMEESRKHM